MISTSSLHHRLTSVLTSAWRLGILLLPTTLLVGASLRQAGDTQQTMLWLGTGFQILVCFLTFCSRGSWDQPLGPSVVTLYLIALAWLWLGSRSEDWFIHFAKAILLVVPLTVLGFQTLHESG